MASSVRATTSTWLASSTPEMYVFWPLSTHPSPSRVAVVVMLWEFEPASASVMPNAIVYSPDAMPGSQRPLCSSVPKRPMTEPQIACETTIISIGAPAAAASSRTAARSPMPPPPPPCSSAMFTPRKPWRPMSCHSSVTLPPSRAFSAM